MRASHFSLLGLCIALTAPAHAIDGLKVYTTGGENPAAMACATCHGPDAMGMAAAGFPRLAGLAPEYLAKQIADLKSGTRSNPVMQPIAAALSDDEVQAVSSYLSVLPAPKYPTPSRGDEVSDLGSTLALRGAWERSVPECVSCHGPGGVGVGKSFPPLAGQSAQYLSSQLQAWRQGTRRNDPNDLMGHIARSLTEDEIKAVSEYFASLPVQGGAQ